MQPLKNYVLPPIPYYFSWLLQIPAHASLTPTSGIYHRLQPATSCSQVDYQTNTVLLTVVMLYVRQMLLTFDFVTLILLFVMSAVAVCRFVDCMAIHSFYFTEYKLHKNNMKNKRSLLKVFHRTERPVALYRHIIYRAVVVPYTVIQPAAPLRSHALIFVLGLTLTCHSRSKSLEMTSRVCKA